MTKKLTHIDADGEAKMVDVSEKRQTERVAIAAGKITMKPETLNLIQQGRVKKGDAMSVARLAGIMGAKKTSDLIPLCHPLALNAIEVELSPSPNDNSIEIKASCKVKGRTGVEMEALTACSIASLKSNFIYFPSNLFNATTDIFLSFIIFCSFSLSCGLRIESNFLFNAIADFLSILTFLPLGNSI